MKPDKPGEWHSRDGRKIVVYGVHGDGQLLWRDCSGSVGRCRFLICDLDGDDWLPATAPTFPELPARPANALPMFWCCVRADSFTFWIGVRRGQWRIVRADGHTLPQYRVENCEIVPHPDNDPEAEEIIRAARGLQ